MVLNKQKGNMYPWVTHTWNPICGYCEHDCSYCFMKSSPWDVGELRLNKKALKDNLGQGNTIFVGSSTDMFAENVPESWIDLVLDACCRYQENIYVFQSKNPLRFINFEYQYPKYTQLGTTIESNRDYNVSKAPSVLCRKRVMQCLRSTDFPVFITIEPILDFDVDVLSKWIKEIYPLFINIGADSKNHNLPEPIKEKILQLLESLSSYTSIKIQQKENLKRILQKG